MNVTFSIAVLTILSATVYGLWTSTTPIIAKVLVTTVYVVIAVAAHVPIIALERKK